MTAPAPATAYSYLRLSSARQANKADQKAYKDGFRRQVALRDAYLKKNPHLRLDTSLTLHDIGVSAYTAANIARGGTGKLAAFRAMVEAGKIAAGSYLLVESLDRLSRAQVNEALELLLSLINREIIVVTLMDEQIYRRGADPTQFLISIVHMMRSFEESDLKSKRLRSTWDNKRQNIGERKLTARAPAWLHLNGSLFEPIPERVDVVRRILRELADGIGRDKIAMRLNQEGVPCWGHGRGWHGGTVQKITDSEALRGYFQPHKLVFEERDGKRISKRIPIGDPIPNYFPAVVDDELWFSARRIATERMRRHGGNSGGRQGTVISNLFGGLATCGVCGSPMNYRDRGPRSRPILRCSSERAGQCSNHYRYPYQATEDVVLSSAVFLAPQRSEPSELSNLESRIRIKLGERDSLQVQGENIVNELGQGNRFALRRLAEIDRSLSAVENDIHLIEIRLEKLRAADRIEEREVALSKMLDLQGNDAPEAEIFAARSRIRQIIRDTFQSMVFYPDGHVAITTENGESYLYRDGFYLKDGRKFPSAYSFFGLFADRRRPSKSKKD
ncbi:Recombinase zinc beta ribbon domain-containing protein [Methylobacterium sp. 174MFSha1.1]|uniref:recombinase family protein n=1 Tax=Methylobacterium sp. 174MFSha1.1 TaxID=1502749 RepID=UPI0008F13D86|nr:recombinase family protein [Methylobacterium sp. 174MFSha1.1]SFV10983.1 Recombinase zinc beta ribbon domain-containing protein [Methylobacterium sp. 174MFSha1.1]